MVKVMVTGGAGFIGSHIVDALLNEKHDVVIVDNLSTGSRKNINPGARFYEVNICSSDIAHVFESERPQIVCHQAAQTVISRSVTDPLFDANVNILGSVNLISNCLRYGVKKLIYASSGGAVYGEPEHLPATEQYPVNPLSQYGASKHTVEHYLHLYWLQHGLEYVSLRYSNIYGPRQNPSGEAGVIAIFTGQMLRAEQPTIFGKGDKTRDYTYVADIARANLLAMPAGKTGIYNIGTGAETSDRQIFDIVAQNVGYKGEPKHSPVRKGEIYRICLDSSKAKAELGWEPLTSVKNGIAQTVGFFKGNH
ncbi:MAG: NAD-dependent epimerase/dehydratase family protein [Dehalococcoidia bacterium]|nr:NAD-dependent epimerase/dehydratase family protein [Dehalococcoidia bacterium]